MFADDCLLFVKAAPKGARNVLQILNRFALADGQQMNFHKSLFTFQITKTIRIEIILSIFFIFNIKLPLVNN